MTVGELKMLLEELLENEEVTEDTEVRIATQENWPFENNVSGLTTRADIRDVCEDSDDDEDFEDEDLDGSVDLEEHPEKNHVYLTEGSQIGYFTKVAWSAER